MHRRVFSQRLGLDIALPICPSHYKRQPIEDPSRDCCHQHRGGGDSAPHFVARAVFAGSRWIWEPPEGLNDHKDPQQWRRNGEGKVNPKAVINNPRRVIRRRLGQRSPILCDQVQINLESRYGDQQDNGQRQLNPLVPLAFVRLFRAPKSDQTDAPRQHGNDAKHRHKHEIEHPRPARREKPMQRLGALLGQQLEHIEPQRTCFEPERCRF